MLRETGNEEQVLDRTAEVAATIAEEGLRHVSDSAPGYAYGLGLLAARRYADLFKLFTFPLVTDRDTTSNVVGHLFLSAWAGGENNVWQIVPGLERRKTALSDHCMISFRLGPATICFRQKVTPPSLKNSNCWARSPTSHSAAAKRICKASRNARRTNLSGVPLDGCHGTDNGAIRVTFADAAIRGVKYCRPNDNPTLGRLKGGWRAGVHGQEARCQEIRASRSLRSRTGSTK
jgi:hypothetical protein